MYLTEQNGVTLLMEPASLPKRECMLLSFQRTCLLVLLIKKACVCVYAGFVLQEIPRQEGADKFLCSGKKIFSYGCAVSEGDSVSDKIQLVPSVCNTEVMWSVLFVPSRSLRLISVYCEGMNGLRRN